MPSSCPCCGSQWPDDRWKWAQPGLYFGTFHRMEDRTVTFCRFSCGNPLYCPPSLLATEYDAGLFPDIEATPSCKVIDERMGLTWFWKVRQADRLTRLKHFVSRLGVVSNYFNYVIVRDMMADSDGGQRWRTAMP
jgi:hypothetical protein